MIDQGGFAFPQVYEIDGNWVKDPIPEKSGMTLRDYFAGQAMISACEDWNPEECAKMAYEYADAMIAERNKK